jgi:hypothetical protein
VGDGALLIPAISIRAPPLKISTMYEKKRKKMRKERRGGE